MKKGEKKTRKTVINVLKYPKEVVSLICSLCPRNCKAERNENEGFGFCGMPASPVIARAAIHKWEEPCISGENGTGAIFFSGCNLKCCFCQNFDISHHNKGIPVTNERLADIMRKLENEGVHTIDLVNPTHFSDAIAAALKIYKPSIPIVYNSSGYDSVETLKRFEGLVDVYLPDIKYFDSEKSLRYAGCSDYFEKASAAVLEMYRQQSETVFCGGIIKRGVIIRHLVLPSNTDQSKKILSWIKNNLPNDIYISLMSQYTPCGNVTSFKEINRRLTTAEYTKVIDHFFDIGLKNGFMQEKSSANADFIPQFDGTGVKPY